MVDINNYTNSNLLAISNIAASIKINLQSDDKRFNQAVLIIHQEGTTLFYQNCFAEQRGSWWMIFPEHHPLRVYHQEDLFKLIQYQRLDESYEDFTGVKDV